MSELKLHDRWKQRFSDRKPPPRPDAGSARSEKQPDATTSTVSDLPHHVGLWLDRGLQWPPDATSTQARAARDNLYDIAVRALDQSAPARDTYARCIKRIVEQTPPTAHRRVFHVTTQSRVLLHTATNASVTEGAILLHHTYGVPYLPGSALKGVTRASMRGTKAASEDLQAYWFGRGGDDDGTGDQAAAFDILDALWCPKADDPSPLAVDIVNPHHPDYYSKGAPPRDSDDPTPVHRLSLRPNVRFRAVLEFAPGLQSSDIDAFCEYFLHAVRELGVGAWTTSGYGKALASRIDAPGL